MTGIFLIVGALQVVVPRLHIHAQRRGTDEMPLGGEPLWVIFEGKFLVRNQLVVR